MNNLADKFIKAGRGHEDAGITPEDLAVLGLGKVPKTFQYAGRRVRTDTWEGLCAYVYEKLTSRPHPGSRAIGAGFRSQQFGQHVADAIRAKFSCAECGCYGCDGSCADYRPD